MAYVGKTNWVNNEIVEAADMNRIEAGISDNDDRITSHETDAEAHAELLDTKVNRSGDTMTGALDAPDLKVNGVSVYHPSNKPTPDDIGAAKQSQLSNPNLLDNPDFAINQRGQSEYVNSDLYHAYTVDRWRIIGTLSVGDGHVVAKKDASPYGYGILSQLVPGGTALEGKMLTLSAIINSVLVTVTGPLSATPVSKQIGSGDTIGFQLDSGLISVFLNVTGGDLTIAKCSLELGDVSTLANVPPVDYGEELRKCQRYLWVPDCSVSLNPIAVGLIINDTGAVYMLRFPQKMRIVPTIVPYGQFVAYNNMNHTGTLIVGSTSQESCKLMFTITDETTFSMGSSAGTMLLANPLGGSKIIVSAEL